MEMPTQSPGDAVRAVGQEVVEHPGSSEVGQQLEDAIAAITAHADRVQDPVQGALLRANVTLLAAAKASMQSIGECQIVEPHADVYVVMTSSGRRYCCTHNPQHCMA